MISVDDRLLDAEATDLGGAVGDVSGEETNRLVVLDDARELEDFLPGDLGILDLVQKHPDRIDGDAPGLRGFDSLLHHDQVFFHQDVGLRDEGDLDQAAVDVAIEIQSEAPGRRAQPLLGLLEGKDDPLLARSGAVGQEFEHKDRLSGPRNSRDEEAGAKGDPVFDALVELRDAGLAALPL